VNAKRRGSRTRSKILEAARESFAQKGYDATSVAEICSRAGVTKGGFYHHFPSKQALFLDLLERWLEGLDGQLVAVRNGAATVPEGFLQMAGMIGQVFEAAGGQLPMFLEFWNKAAHDPDIWQATIAPYRRYRAFFAEMVEAGIAEGTLRRVDSEIAAQVLVSLAAGLVLQGVLDPQGAEWREVTERSLRMLLEGLRRRG
jgi:AcrR family transcriptional regulator